jgi:hypothetical protein
VSKKTKKSSAAKGRRKLEEMPFGEALERFIQTKPKELDRALEQYEKLKEDAEALEKQVIDDQDRVEGRLKGRRRSGKKGSGI